MLYKPSDQSYSMSVDFWYEPNLITIKSERIDPFGKFETSYQRKDNISEMKSL